MVFTILVASGPSCRPESSINKTNAAPEIPSVSLGSAQASVKESIEIVIQQVSADRSDASAWGKLGIVYLAHGFKSAADQCFSTAEELDPSDYRWPHLLSYAISENSVDKVASSIQRAVERNKQDTSSRMRLAHIELRRGRVNEARHQFAIIAGESPMDINALFGLAQCAFQSKEDDRALELLTELRRRQPNNKEAYALLSQLYHRLGRPNNARLASQRANALPARTPESADPLVHRYESEAVDASSLARRGTNLVHAGRTDEGLALLERAIDIAPDIAANHRALGAALTSTGRVDDAIAAINRALELSPDRPRILIDLGVAYVARSDFESAKSTFERIVAIDPLDVAAHYNLASMHARLGQPHAAIESFRKCVELNPGDYRLYRNLAKLFLAIGDVDRAFAEHEKCIEFEPFDRANYLSLASLYNSQGKRQEAVETLDRGLKHFPQDSQMQSTRQTLASSPNAPGTTLPADEN